MHVGSFDLKVNKLNVGSYYLVIPSIRDGDKHKHVSLLGITVIVWVLLKTFTGQNASEVNALFTK